MAFPMGSQGSGMLGVCRPRAAGFSGTRFVSRDRHSSVLKNHRSESFSLGDVLHPVVFRVWSLDQQHQHHMGTF